MKTYQNFSFQDRASQAADAKQRKLEQLRAKPPVDPSAQQARIVASEKRQAAEAEKRANRKASDEAAEQAARDHKAASEKAEAARLEAEAARLAAIKPEPTAEERKLARDAKYAARKNRR